MTDENPYATPEAEITAPDDGSGELASLGARFGGAVIDGLIAIATIWPAMYLLGMFDRALDGQQSIEDIVGGAVLGFALFLLINGYLLANRGQTVGKMLVKTRIVSVEDKKILPLWKLILLRYVPVSVVAYVPLIGPILNLVNVLIIFRDDRRCGHDHIAGTVVIKAV